MRGERACVALVGVALAFRVLHMRVVSTLGMEDMAGICPSRVLWRSNAYRLDLRLSFIEDLLDDRVLVCRAKFTFQQRF